MPRKNLKKLKQIKEKDEIKSFFITLIYAKGVNRFRSDYELIINLKEFTLSQIKLLSFKREFNVLTEFFQLSEYENRTIIYSLDRRYLQQVYKAKDLIKADLKNMPMKLEYKTFKISDCHRYQDTVVNMMEYESASLKAKLEALTIQHDSSIFREFISKCYTMMISFQAQIIREGNFKKEVQV